jgi:hypothetical protein
MHASQKKDERDTFIIFTSLHAKRQYQVILDTMMPVTGTNDKPVGGANTALSMSVQSEATLGSRRYVHVSLLFVCCVVSVGVASSLLSFSVLIRSLAHR